MIAITIFTTESKYYLSHKFPTTQHSSNLEKKARKKLILPIK